MEASNISWIVYELVRVKDDRNSMKHEDVLGHYQAKILELRSKNRRLNFQLKDLYGKYESAMRCDNFNLEGNRSASSGTKVPSLEISNHSGILSQKQPVRTHLSSFNGSNLLLDDSTNQNRGSSSRRSSEKAAEVGNSDRDIAGRNRVWGNTHSSTGADKGSSKACPVGEALIPLASHQVIVTSDKSDIVKCKITSSTEDVKKDVDATYYESSDGSDKMDQNMIQNLIEESEAARKMMSSTRASSQSRQVGHIYSYDSENVKKSIKPQNTNERLQINNRRKTEVESSVEVSHILKGHHLLSDKNVVALKLCLKEFDLSSNELSNGEKDDQHESDGENKNNQTKTKIKTKSPTPTEKVAKKEKIYLTNDMINEIIKIMPQTYADLPAALQKENLRTQHRLLISLHNFLEQYDILHLFPTLNAINTPEMWCLVYARRHTELRILLKCGNENANENENENENENDDKDQINKDCKDKNTNGIVIRHRLNQRREKEDNHAIDKNESKMMKVFKTGNSIESENSLISDRPVRSRFNNASSSSSSSSSSFSSSFAPSTSLSSLSAQGTNGKNDGGVMILVNGVWSPTTNRKRDQHGKIKTPDGLADFDKSNIQAASIVDANDRDEDSKCIGSNIDKKSKKNLVGVLDCSISEGVRIVADTVTMTGVETGTEIMIMVGKQISGCTEEEIEEQKEKEKEKEKEIVKGNEKKTSAGSRLKEGLGLSLGVESVTRGKTVSKGDRGALDVENIHINLRQPFRSTTMFSKNSMHAPAGPIPSAAAVPSTASSSSSSSSSASSSLRSSSSSSSTAAAAAAAAPSSSSRTAAASLSSSSSSSSSGGMMRRGLTEINPPKGPPSHADSTLQRRNTVAGSVRTRTGTPTGTGLSRGISTDMKSRTEIGKDSGKHVAKCVEIVRKKSERESLPGHKCTECAAFYGALQQQGIVSEDGMEEMLQRCSRHKARWSPPHTPEGFWDLSVRTPEKWRE